jgi:CO dehydrogenase maturation factor
VSYLVAVTGKGGTGKTTLSAVLIRLLLQNGIRPVLAVDADPNSSLGPLLGLQSSATISDMREEVLKEKASVTAIPKERILEMKLGEAIQEADGFDLLTMGRPEGPTCYCYVNSLLRGSLARLRNNYRVTVVDNEAGMEHLSRMNTDTIDCLVLVSEPTPVSARAVRRILGLSSTLPVTVRRKVLVWNKVPPSGIPPAIKTLIGEDSFDDSVNLPSDEEIARLSLLEENALTASIPEPFDRLVKACVTEAGMQPAKMRG